MTAIAEPHAGSRALPWVAGLAAHGDRAAIITADSTTTYAALSARVDRLAARLAGPRRLVLVEGAATTETVVAHLATLAAGHVVLLAAAGADGPSGALRAAYDPDIVLGPDGSVEVLRELSAHELHADLTLLLSTSGSTGSAKLVRLSAENLAANAEQIAGYLDIREDDCAAMTLPLTYCYGLSVLHTHLARGASVLLTDLSVVDECFWELFQSVGATTFPAVPHTFELLERSGFAGRDLPRLRYVTQAGGRMDPERVCRWAETGRRSGWDLFVMYGQCEATARMTWLPPHLARSHPDAVGLPVPGASVDIVDGEIVFRGPNVMLGYAETPADLALGRTLTELRTGDLGRISDDGLLHVVGRRARFVKVLGHRIDLDGIEQRLRRDGHDVRCAGRDGLVVMSAVAVRGGADGGEPSLDLLRRAALRACGVPWDALGIVAVESHPRLGSGKPNYPAILRLGDDDVDRRDAAGGLDGAEGVGGVGRADGADGADGVGSRSVAALYASLLHRSSVADDASFVTLGGDSLSYVEVSIRLEGLLGDLPASWHVMSVRDLDGLRVAECPAAQRVSAGRSRASVRFNRLTDGATTWRAMESSVWLRALAIVLIVGTHADLFALQGTANALLVIAGYQLVRFQLSVPDRRTRVSRVLRSIGRIAAPTLVVIGAAHALGGYYETRNLFLANWLYGEEQLGPAWRFWFIEAIVVALVVTAAICAVPAIHRSERRHPFGLPLALTVAAFVLLRLPVLPLPVPRMHGSALVVLHLFLLGWTLARVTTAAQRRLMTVVAGLMILTFSFNPARDGLTLAFVLVLMWLPVTRVPAVLVPMIRVLAAGSLFIYVIHWQALELLWGRPLLAFGGSLALGMAYWWCWAHLVDPVLHRLSAHVRSRSQRLPSALRGSAERRFIPSNASGPPAPAATRARPHHVHRLQRPHLP